MEKSQLQELFCKPFDHKAWQEVLTDVFGVTEIRHEPRQLENESNDKVGGYEVGWLDTKDGHHIGIYEFEIKSGHNITMNRVGLRGLVKGLVKYQDDAALVVFYNKEQWRLSFISDLKDSKTAPKRFTYVLGNPTETYRTPAERLAALISSEVTFDAIRTAFSVEQLNKDFFKGYKEQFRKFTDKLCEGREQTKQDRDYVKKLLGRLVFLQFLQKKGWMGVPASHKDWTGGDHDYLQKLIGRHKDNARLLSDVLEPLFFATLNKRREGDIADPILGDNIKVPYLNGGLFDDDSRDAQDIDFPYSYFAELADFFSAYNFTIDENDPDDSEVGIDPEMLGHIFENLLEDNKDKGAFYTPKEIVHYMCRESLVQYLRSHNEELHEAIDGLVRGGLADFFANNRPAAVAVDNLLREVKICDPAIGSGAFPMGLLAEIFRCRRLLYGHMKTGEPFSPSKIKREIIQENIYGVDIEQGAVDIARLRFWLSLVVDEPQPEPLPNLDYKIMQGNSLLESFAGLPLDKIGEIHKSAFSTDLFSVDTEISFSEDIDCLMDSYFGTTDHNIKADLRNRIESQVKERIGYSINRQLEDKHESIEALKRQLTANSPQSKHKFIETLEKEYAKLLEKVAKLRYITEGNRPYFLWHTYFKDVFDKGGFDIVIANPPYKILTKNNTDSDELFCYLNDYEAIKRSNSKNLFTLFIELGVDKLLSDKAILSYIIPEGLFKTRSYEGCTAIMDKKGHTISTVTFTNYVFENAVTGSLIFTYAKSISDTPTKKYHFDSKYQLSEVVEAVNPIIAKVELDTIPLKNVVEIFKGMVVQDRANCIYTEKDGNPNVFLLGKNIVKWGVKSKYYTDYDKLVIIGGTKKLIKHNQYPRILIRRTGDTLCCALLTEPALTESTLYSCWSNTPNVDNRYLLAILNSKLLDYYNKQMHITNQQGFPQILMTDLELLPIKITEDQKPFINVVDQILAAKAANPAADTSALESEIDRMVYELYGLTSKEIAIIEK